jgi:hypothetical protein
LGEKETSENVGLMIAMDAESDEVDLERDEVLKTDLEEVVEEGRERQKKKLYNLSHFK